MLKVLVVNDNRGMLRIINNLLSSKYEAINCQSTDTLDFNDICCLILDSQTNNWIDTARIAIKAGVPFIVVTDGQNKEALMTVVVALGGNNNNYIIRPFTANRLIEKVDGCLFTHLGSVVNKNIQSL